MPFFLAKAALTGSPGVSGWAQVHEFTPDDPQKLATRGHLFAVVAVKGMIDPQEGREIISRLQEEYYGNLESGAFKALEGAISKVVDEFSGIDISVEIAAAAVLGNIVYSSAIGGGQVAIYRSGAIAKILVSAPGNVATASGFPQENDILLLGTKSFFQEISLVQIKEILTEGNPQKAVESLAPGIHLKENLGDLGVIFVRFSKASEKSQEVILKSRVTYSLKKVLGKILPKGGIYIRSEEESQALRAKRKLTVSVGVILLIILIVSIGFGIKSRIAKDYKSRYEARLTEAQHEFDESLTLISLNPERSRELFNSARTKVDSILSEGISAPKVTELNEKLKGNEGPILGIYKTPDNSFLDLSLLSSGFNGDELSSSGETMFILDKSGKKVVSVDFGTKKSEVVAGPSELGSPKAVTSYEDRGFVLTNEGIDEVGKTQVVKKDWEGEGLIYAYAGNLYVLDKMASTIYRFSGVREDFGSKNRWLVESAKPDFSNAIDWTINGAMYVLTRSGRILKFSLGSPQNFSVSGVFPELSSAEAIYTNEENTYIYILDRSGKRIVVLDKEGTFKAQYLSDRVGETKDIVVSEREKKIILLAGSKLYSIEVKHL